MVLDVELVVVINVLELKVLLVESSCLGVYLFVGPGCQVIWGWVVLLQVYILQTLLHQVASNFVGRSARNLLVRDEALGVLLDLLWFIYNFTFDLDRHIIKLVLLRHILVLLPSVVTVSWGSRDLWTTS